MAGFIGAAMAIAGYVRHTIQEIWGWFNLSLLIVGGVLLLASIALNFKDIVEYFRGRSGRLSANVALLTVAVVGLIAIVNFLGYRHHKRLDLTAEGLFSLSDQTKKVLSGLQKDVKVIRFAKENDTLLADQMNEFKYQSKRISYEWVDAQEKPGAARNYAAKNGELVVSTGEGEQRRIERLQQADEQSLLNAILKVTRETLKTICFTEGHDEKALAGDYSQVEGKLKGENYLTKTINLAREKQVPSECAVLVVAGPKIPLFQPEVGMIGQYLDGGGKAMLLLDPETDPQLDEVLKKWNVVVGNDYLLDVSGIGQQVGFGPAAPLVFNYGTHPITDRFGRTPTVFPEARSVKVGEGAGSGVNATTLLTTSEYSWGETELKPGVEPKFDEGKDAKGPVSLGVVGSKSQGENKESRLVVVGDSDFAANMAFRRAQRNGDLFMNSINWLAQDEDLISIRPKTATNRSVTMSGAQLNTFWWLVVVVLPLGIIGIGSFIWWKRR